MVVPRLIKVVMTPPAVSIPKLRGETSSSKTRLAGGCQTLTLFRVIVLVVPFASVPVAVILTGESFVEVKRKLREKSDKRRLLGWYHTHLFPATDDFGLSSIDYTLHFGTFTIPWQLAGLINIDGADRTLRFYRREAIEMLLCPYWVINERA